MRLAEHGPGDGADGGHDGVRGRRATYIKGIFHDGIARSGRVGAERGRNRERESDEEHQARDAGDEPEPNGDHPNGRFHNKIRFHWSLGQFAFVGGSAGPRKLRPQPMED